MEEKNNLEESLEIRSPEDRVEEIHETAEAKPAPVNQNELNIRELREQKKRLERERDELRQRMQAMEESQKSAPQSPSLADDDLVEWKYVKQEIEGLKNHISSHQQKSAATEAEMRLKARYNDFDKVVTSDNIQRLRENYPEIAATLSANNDLYTQASAAYDIIKRYGIYSDDTFDKDKERIQNNTAKPRPSNTASGQRGNSPLDQANAFAEGLTPELKEQLRREMRDAIKRR